MRAPEIARIEQALSGQGLLVENVPYEKDGAWLFPFYLFSHTASLGAAADGIAAVRKLGYLITVEFAGADDHGHGWAIVREGGGTRAPRGDRGSARTAVRVPVGDGDVR